jgi:hypothetical protein
MIGAALLCSEMNFMKISDPTTRRRLIASAPAAALALVATFLMLDATAGNSDLRTMIVVSLADAWLAVVATAIFASAHRWSLPRDLGAQLIAGSLAAAAPWAPAQAGLFGPTFFAGLAFASLAAPLGRLTRAEAYWTWVEKLCLAAALATLGAIVGFAAILATLLSAATLFDIDGLTFGAIAPKLASVMFCAVAPNAFLALRPPVVESTLNEREGDFVRRAAAALACYALAPFVLVYSALLWAYAGKIALERSLPTGQIGVMVGAFGFAAILTILLIFPERSRGPFTARWLWRIWPFLLPAPLVLLGFAIVERVEAYGLTPDRYVASALALLCAASGVAALGDRDRVIRFTPAATALVLLLASFGPFGAVATSARWQSANLSSILAAHGLLRPDGRLVVEGAPVALSETETRKWRAATDLLRQIDRAPSLFGPEAPTTADALQRLDARVALAKIEGVSASARARWRSLSIQERWVASADDALDDVSILGSIHLSAFPRNGDGSAPTDPLHAAIDGVHLSVEPPGEAAATFDLSDLVRRLAAGAERISRPQILEPTSDGNSGLCLLVEGITLGIDDEGAQIRDITALVLKRAKRRESAHSR